MCDPNASIDTNQWTERYIYEVPGFRLFLKLRFWISFNLNRIIFETSDEMRTYSGVWFLLVCVFRTSVSQDGESLASSFFSGKSEVEVQKLLIVVAVNSNPISPYIIYKVLGSRVWRGSMLELVAWDSAVKTLSTLLYLFRGLNSTSKKLSIFFHLMSKVFLLGWKWGMKQKIHSQFYLKPWFDRHQARAQGNAKWTLQPIRDLKSPFQQPSVARFSSDLIRNVGNRWKKITLFLKVRKSHKLQNVPQAAGSYWLTDRYKFEKIGSYHLRIESRITFANHARHFFYDLSQMSFVGISTMDYTFFLWCLSRSDVAYHVGYFHFPIFCSEELGCYLVVPHSQVFRPRTSSTWSFYSIHLPL